MTEREARASGLPRPARDFTNEIRRIAYYALGKDKEE